MIRSRPGTLSTLGAAIAAIAAVPLSAAPANAQSKPAAGDPTAYACNFKTGTNRTYTNGRFRAAPVKPLSFTIEAIDLDGQKARLVTQGGKGPLRIVRAVGANHFLEVVTEGYLNVTTVYALDRKRRAYPAVHSRHIGLFGEPLVAQYVGYCTAPGNRAPGKAVRSQAEKQKGKAGKTTK